ncbi:MAG: hypothetical protein NTV47_01150 [Actinobacteria bacterium]|nr:hypothetical protein [Actinomycetota bacterium]
MDIIIGATISIIGTFLFNLWLSSRAESKRWDANRLRALTDARVDFQRALGAIESMAAKNFEIPQSRKRPQIIERAIDRAWYSLEELAILFPSVEVDVKALQQSLVEREGFAFDSLEKTNSLDYYKTNVKPDEKSVREIQDRVLRECQAIVGIK